jgi:dihydroceramidase
MMVELSPKVIAFILGCVLVVTTTQYFFDTSWSSSKGNSPTNASNYYGEPNAEFDWCEENYEISEYVAEFVNTVTGFLYFLPTIFGFMFHKKLSLSSKLLLFFVSCIGFGTVLFHGSLQYKAQLIDELPIYYVILAGNFMLWYRGRKGDRTSAYCLCLWAGGLSAILLFTNRTNYLHTVGRGIMSCSFSLMFGYIFSAAAAALNEIASVKNQGCAQSGKDLFHLAFFEFVAAIFCWIFDNSACAIVQRNPFYPITAHALWHLLTSIGLYKMFLVLEFIHINSQEEAANPSEIKWICGNFLPILKSEKQD